MSNVAAGKDTDDEGEVLNDVEKTLNSLNIALRSSKGEWRSFEDVLDEVAGKWKEFTDTEKSHIATAIAGTRQQENFRAMMNNWEEVERLTRVAADSTGSATERMDTYLDSVEAKTNNLKSAWEGFVMSLNQSDSWKQLLDWLTQFLEKLQYVDWKLVGIIATGGGILTLILKIAPAIKTLISTIKAGGIIAGISSGGIIPILGLIATAIMTISTAWKSANENAEQQVKEIQEQKKALNEEENEAKELVKTYNDLMSKRGVYGLAEEEKKQLLDVSQKLVETYGFEYDGIDSLTGAYKIASDAMDNYTESIERQREAYSKEEQNKRREDIDKRLQELSWEDVDYERESSYRDMGKDFDTNLYFSYNKEKAAIISKIQEQMIGFLPETISQTTQNMILDQIKKDTTNMSAGKIREQFSDEYLSKLGDFASKYDSFITKLSQSEKKYTDLISKNGVLQLSEVDGYKEALENRLAIYKKMQEEGLISQDDFNNRVSQLENELNSRFDFAMKTISESLGENAGEFNNVANNLLEFTSQLKNGEKTISDYVNSVADLTEKIDLKEVFNGNTESALQFFSTLSTQLTNVLNLISNNYSNGIYASNNDYINDLIKWGESLQRVGNKMQTIEGADRNAKGNYSVEDNDRIAVVNKNDSRSYIMNRATFDKEKQQQTTLANVKAIFDGMKNGGDIDYDGLRELTGEVILRNVEGYDFFYDRAKENEKNGKGSIIYDEDYFEYLRNNLDNGEEIVNRFKELLKQEKELETEQDKINLWNDATNRYNENNTKIIENSEEVINDYQSQIDTLKQQRDSLQSEYDDIRDNQSVFTLNPIENIVEGKKKDFFDWDFIDDTAKEKALQEKQDEIDRTNDKIKEYENKLDDARNSEETFESAVADANAEIQEQETAAEGTSNAANDMAEAIRNLKDLQDSISAIEGINSGAIIEGTAEFGSAIETIATDVYNSVRDTSGNIKQEYIDVYGETSALFSGTVQDLVAAYQKGEITLEQFQAVLKQSVQDNINKLKNAVGDFLISVGQQFENFEVTLKITMNTGNIGDKIKNAIAGITGQDINVGEIKVSSDGISNTLSTLGNAIKNTPLEFDFSYTPVNTNDFGGRGGAGSSGSKGYTPSGGGSKNKKSGSEYTPEEAEKDKKSILNDIEDYERDIEADLEDQTEQLVNHYNLERNKLETLREELDYYDAIYDSTENTTKWLETQLDILDEESKKISEMQQSNEKIDAQRKKIYAENKQYNVESWFDSEGNDTLAYGDMLNSFEYKKEAIQKEVAQKMRAEYNRIANSTDKDAIKDAKEKIKLIEEEGDLRIKELEKEKERIENIHDSVETLNDAWDENQEKIRESLQELNDRIKSIRDELIDDLMEQLERATDKMNKSLESNATRLEQLKQVQESYNSLLNDTLDTQDELMDELQANLDSYQYLDEDMRQLMFNEDDYKKLSGVLGDIQEDIAGIWEDHYSQISNLSEDEMYKAQYITAETERQLAAKQKEYDLARAELDIAKAKTNLENVKNERNTRIFANGQWQWVADPTAVRDAQKALADQERAKNKIEREAEQQELIDSLDRLIDSDNLQIDENNDLLEKIQEAIEQETEEVKSIDQALENIKNANLPEINTTLINALGKDGGHMTELLKNINKNQTSLAAALRGQTIEQAEKQLKSGTMDKKAFEELVTRLGYSFNESTGKITTQDGSFDAHYAGWTKKPNNDIQTGTANNGVQVTGGNGGQQQHSPSSTIDSVANKNSQEALKQIAREVWLGKWGNGQDRKNRLTAAGYDYAAVQALVNKGRKYFFDQGGVSTGIGLMPKDTLEPERVLSPRQTKSFDNLVNNLTTNPVLSALSRNPSVVSNLTNMGGTTSSDKNYYFSNFTIQSDDIGQFISSIETMIPMKNN